MTTTMSLRPATFDTDDPHDDACSRDIPIWQLPVGARFCMRTPSVWGYPETRVYGEVIHIDAGRARVLLSGGQHQVVFGTADDKIRVFEAQGAAEINWPRDITVEPIDWEGHTASQNVRGEDPGERSSVMTDTKISQATGIQARYDYNVKMLAKAVHDADEAKATMLQAKVTAIKNEAEAKGVKLEMGVVQPRASGPEIVTGESVPKAKKVAKSAKAPADPEAQAAMANLDKVKAKANGEAKPAAKPKSTHDCICGCGQETFSLFAPGHDARIKGMILKVERGELERDVIPETVAPFVKFVGKWVKGGSDSFKLTAAPVKIPGRPDVKHTAVEALEALDI